jgi:hypothetical protein
MVRPFGVARIGVANKEVIEITGKYTAKVKSSFSSSIFLPGSGTKATQLTNLFCLKEPNKIKNEVWFYVLMTTTSKSMVFLDHQNKCRLALRFEVSSL